MNAETGSEPESPKKRGRIPQSAWPQILERYHGGVTLSAIAREFECTPSAISYIIKKAEAASGQGELSVGADVGETTPAQPETVDAAPPEAAPVATPVVETPVAETAAAETPAAEPRRDARPARA
ncbi:helix-turn-helix domain containing protein, partial [Azospirillum doebereinerae]|uniref:helix-turn-helix domain-containing protein n=1 Tax=Azospirillum doebereinerae TaxID=92933 RepID=UPI001EE572EA